VVLLFFLLAHTDLLPLYVLDFSGPHFAIPSSFRACPLYPLPVFNSTCFSLLFRNAPLTVNTYHALTRIFHSYVNSLSAVIGIICQCGKELFSTAFCCANGDFVLLRLLLSEMPARIFSISLCPRILFSRPRSHPVHLFLSPIVFFPFPL